MGQVTVFSGLERRRAVEREEQLQILSEAFAPGVRVADICRRRDISSGLIGTWRRKLRDAEAARTADLSEAMSAPVFVEAIMDEARGLANTVGHPAMIIELPRGKRLSIYPGASPSLAAATLSDLT
jgi:transposase